MTDIVNPPAAPTVPPYPALGSANFNAEAYTYGSNMPGVVAGIQAMCQAAWTNALATQERAAAANTSAGTATQQADAAMGYRNQANAAASTANARSIEAANSAAAAEASRIEASKLNLGNKSVPPTTDNQGQALRAGATYYDTSANKWRVWSGSAWGDGISTVAGVSSFNGKTGPVNETTLAGLGILNFRVDEALPEPTDLGTVLTSGVYRFNAATDNPQGILYSPLFVTRTFDTCAQTIVDYATGVAYTRSGIVQNGVLVDPNNPAKRPTWRRAAYQNDPYIITGDGVMDLSRRTRFAITVAGSAGLSFINIPADSAVSVAVEVNFVSGSFTLPPGSVWVNGVVPTMATGKRHLLYFERALVGNTSAWYVSALPGFAQ